MNFKENDNLNINECLKLILHLKNIYKNNM